ncbi:MAG TPA: hypothetical protein VF406_21250 [Thermodesulfobacteriota bacterium]
MSAWVFLLGRVAGAPTPVGQGAERRIILRLRVADIGVGPGEEGPARVQDWRVLAVGPTVEVAEGLAVGAVVLVEGRPRVRVEKGVTVNGTEVTGHRLEVEAATLLPAEGIVDLLGPEAAVASATVAPRTPTPPAAAEAHPRSCRTCGRGFDTTDRRVHHCPACRAGRATKESA